MPTAWQGRLDTGCPSQKEIWAGNQRRECGSLTVVVGFEELTPLTFNMVLQAAAFGHLALSAGGDLGETAFHFVHVGCVRFAKAEEFSAATADDWQVFCF